MIVGVNLCKIKSPNLLYILETFCTSVWVSKNANSSDAANFLQGLEQGPIL